MTRIDRYKLHLEPTNLLNQLTCLSHVTLYFFPGVGLPLGDMGYSNSEFIVYKPDQVVLRYLIQFRS